jgi:hypothetical protein
MPLREIAMWVFCPSNGPAPIKVGFASSALQKVGRHVWGVGAFHPPNKQLLSFNFRLSTSRSTVGVIWCSSLKTKRLFIRREMDMQAIPILDAI